MGDLLNQQLCNELRDVIYETDIFIRDEKESKRFLFICALMDRFDTAAKYINEHQKKPDSEEELIIFMVYSCIIKDGIDYIKKSLKIGKSKDRKIFEDIYKKEPINISDNVQFDDDKFFSYFRSLIFAHPLYTSRSIPMSEENEIQYSPYIVMEPLYTQTFIDPIGTDIYSNKREIMKPLLISFKSLKKYIKGKYEELNDVITKFKQIIEEKETEWKKHKVNRDQEAVDVLKDCVNILKERYVDTYEIHKLITYLTCENSFEENIENVNKYRNEIKRIIPSICDAMDLNDIEELYNIISFILFVRPKTDNKIHYNLEKIYDYLNNKNKDIDDIEWGLKQAELFAQGFSKKWVVIKPREMDYDEIKMLTQVACYLEYMEQKEGKMSKYNIVFEMKNSTVVAEYEPLKKKSDAYQSEAALEKEFVKMLSEQGYEYLRVHDADGLVNNLRTQLELLNDYRFSENEWLRFFNNNIANNNEGIVEKSKKIQEDHIQVLKKDDGTSRNIYLIDKKNIHNNRLQVINQYVENGGNYDNRYDVSVLVNGLPLVHIELKRRGVALKEAFNQINRYQKDSFWAGSGLYEYVQIFVISNGTNTKYYSNTTRESHIKEKISCKNKSKKTSNSFEFTSYWADANNKVIADLVDFTRTFFSKHTILNILTKYCVFTSEELLLVMRPYQIVATERILNKIEVATNYKKMGTTESGGYIWHTTGSGKTLTSFKTAQLASKLDYIDKVLFVVDRKDLDYQTMREYDRFEKGAANGNRNTKILQKQIEDNDARIIVTTIQKLSEFVKRNASHPAFKKHIVLIFDECHRSQFGDMHKLIVKNFKNYHLFRIYWNTYIC